MMTGIDQQSRARGSTGQRAGRRWLAAAVAWLVALPVALLTLALIWALAREYGGGNVGQYALALPATVLVALAVWLTLRALHRQRWALAAIVVSMLMMAGAALGASTLGLSAREANVQAACSAEDIEVLRGLPVFAESGASPAGYPDGRCYLRYAVPGSLAAAAQVLDIQMTADGWDSQAADPRQLNPTIFVKDQVNLYAEVEGLGNLEDMEPPAGTTVFRLTLYESDSQ